MSFGTSSVSTLAIAGCSFFCRGEIRTGGGSAFAQARDEFGVLPVKSMAFARGSAGTASMHVRAEATQAYETRSSAEVNIVQDVEFFCPPDPVTGSCGLSVQQLDLPFAIQLDGVNRGTSVTGIQMSFQPLDAFGSPVSINTLVIPGNFEGNTWRQSLERKLRVTVTPAISTRYRMTAKLGVSASYMGNPGGSDWQTAPESFADMSNSAKLRFDLPPGLGVRGPGGFYSEVSAVPEPGGWAMALAGLAAVAGVARRRARRNERPLNAR
jgi:MYXO-CTERM domain-containing protein